LPLHIDEARNGDIQISFGTDNKGWFVMEIADSGRPFDMTSVPPPDIAADVEDRQIGGLGVHFAKTLTDAIGYRREEGKNILEIRVSPQPSGA
jgi:serine/threonine-protein kinase RsbW